jgi:hypothetical protein
MAVYSLSIVGVGINTGLSDDDDNFGFWPRGCRLGVAASRRLSGGTATVLPT